MITILKRGFDSEIYKIDINGSELQYDKKEVYQRLGVTELIRIPEGEFPVNNSVGQVLTHFNLPIQNRKVPYFAVLAKIVRNGSIGQNGKQEPPILSLDDVWRVEVLTLKTFTSFENIPREYFKSTIGVVGNSSELKRLLIKRYTPVLLGVSPEEIVSQGFSVRQLKLVTKIRHF